MHTRHLLFFSTMQFKIYLYKNYLELLCTHYLQSQELSPPRGSFVSIDLTLLHYRGTLPAAPNSPTP